MAFHLFSGPRERTHEKNASKLSVANQQQNVGDGGRKMWIFVEIKIETGGNELNRIELKAQALVDHKKQSHCQQTQQNDEDNEREKKILSRRQ